MIRDIIHISIQYIYVYLYHIYLSCLPLSTLPLLFFFFPILGRFQPTSQKFTLNNRGFSFSFFFFFSLRFSFLLNVSRQLCCSLSQNICFLKNADLANTNVIYIYNSVIFCFPLFCKTMKCFLLVKVILLLLILYISYHYLEIMYSNSSFFFIIFLNMKQQQVFKIQTNTFT